MESVKGEYVSVYKSGNGDSTNNGLSSKHENLIMVDGRGMTNEEIKKATPESFGNLDCPHTTDDGEDFLVLVEKTFSFGTFLRAVPHSLIVSGKHFMFGGNFVYSSDSRFPSDAPVKVFDRVEG